MLGSFPRLAEIKRKYVITSYTHGVLRLRHRDRIPGSKSTLELKLEGPANISACVPNLSNSLCCHCIFVVFYDYSLEFGSIQYADHDVLFCFILQGPPFDILRCFSLKCSNVFITAFVPLLIILFLLLLLSCLFNLNI